MLPQYTIEIFVLRLGKVFALLKFVRVYLYWMICLLQLFVVFLVRFTRNAWKNQVSECLALLQKDNGAKNFLLIILIPPTRFEQKSFYLYCPHIEYCQPLSMFLIYKSWPHPHIWLLLSAHFLRKSQHQLITLQTLRSKLYYESC